MRSPRSLALEKALASHRFTDMAGFGRWVDSTDALDDTERELVQSATWDDIDATCTAMAATVDQLTAAGRGGVR